MYSVIYRKGGTMRCEWWKLFNTNQSEEHALANKERMERMGYKTLIVKTKDLEVIGMPIGWEPGIIDWENDKIMVDQYRTLHIAKELLQ